MILKWAFASGQGSGRFDMRFKIAITDDTNKAGATNNRANRKK
jgi:hypothetical protein